MKRKKILITGGVGFIGTNLAVNYLAKGHKVTIFDNFSRQGAYDNKSFIQEKFPNTVFIKGDVRDRESLKKAVSGQEVIFHLAGQVAVTTSVENPREDFEINAEGTFNLLEQVRKAGTKPIFIFASTNKVYGGMENVKVMEGKTRYSYKDLPHGVSERFNLDFHSPYGCSKGAADQYVRDYSRIYDIPTVVFRQSCIYGPRQFGIEDQGWVAWFIIACTQGTSITIYGDGKQVRDVLYVDDLVELFDRAIDKIDVAKGKIYNIGGGPKNTLSVWSEFGPILQDLFGRKIEASFSSWRAGDQKIYVSDIRKAEKELGWRPKIEVKEGIEKLFNWVQKNEKLFKKGVTQLI